MQSSDFYLQEKCLVKKLRSDNESDKKKTNNNKQKPA